MRLDDEAFTQGRERESERDRRLAVGLEDEAGPFLGGEALHFDSDRPLADNGKSKEVIPSLGVRRGLARQARPRIQQSDCCTRQKGPGSISYGAGQVEKVLTWAAAEDESSSHTRDGMKTCRLQRDNMRFPPSQAENQYQKRAAVQVLIV